MAVKLPAVMQRYMRRDDGAGQETEPSDPSRNNYGFATGSVISEEHDAAQEGDMQRHEENSVPGGYENDIVHEEKDDVEEESKETELSEGQRRPSRLADASFKTFAASVVVALIVSLAVVGTKAAEDAIITSDVHFYGDSPAVYPSPRGSGSAGWASSYDKARELVHRMTIVEKNSITAGINTGQNGCSGVIPAVERLGFPGLCLSDAGQGLRSVDLVNAYPAGLHVGASWNKDLAIQRATEMGQEFRRKGVQIALGPVVGPLGRVTTGGRNWEGFSADPYLSGALAAETVHGLQGGAGVTACVKHFIGNEQELWRNPGLNAQNEQVEAVSSNIDDRTIHELYLWPFQDALRAGAASVMCSYQRVNNSYGCQNSKTLNGLLKGELGFEGFVVSDWGAQHAGFDGALAGMDMAMPTSDLWEKKLIEAVKNGSISNERLDDMATRIVATWYQMGQDSDDFPSPGYGVPQDINKPHRTVNGRSASSKPVLLQGAMEGHVLVKNSGTLPLKKPQLLSLFGYDGRAENIVNPVGISYPPSPQDQFAPFTLWVGGGSGANSPAYLSDPFSAFSQRAYENDTTLLWDFTSSAPNVDPSSDACIVFINAWASEGYDRAGLHDAHSDDLVAHVAKRCANTIVVLHNAGTRTVDAWIDHRNVTGVILAHLPGQDAGRALVALMYADNNASFSGRLPYTVAANDKQYGALLRHDRPAGKYRYFPQSDFSEGVYIDYRAFDKRKLSPRFEFGFGLTYTTFEYSSLSVALSDGASTTARPPDAATQQGGNPRLFDTVATVACTIANTGPRPAQEVAQLYVGIPGAPARQLRGFDKTRALKPGESVKVEFALTRRDLSVWDVRAQEWMLRPGRYRVWVGRSSRDLPLEGHLDIS